MKLWLISQTERDGYDTFDSAVVAAETEALAKGIHPRSDVWGASPRAWESDAWASSPDHVAAKLIGEAAAGTDEGVVLASFNAG